MNVNSYFVAESYGLFNPLGLKFDTQTGISDDQNIGFQPFDKEYFDPQIKDHECCAEPEPMIEFIRNRLSAYIQWDNNGITYYASLWYILFDPDNLANGGYVPHCDEIIETITTIQNSIIPTWAHNYNCTDDDARWRLFKSIYLYLREEAKARFILNCVHKNCYESMFEWGQSEWYDFQPPISQMDMSLAYLKPDNNCRVIPITGIGRGGYQIRFMYNPVYGIDLTNIEQKTEEGLQIAYDNCCKDCEQNAKSWMNELADYFKVFCKPELADTTSTEWHDFEQYLIDLCKQGCQNNLNNSDFTVSQLIDLYQYRLYLEQWCTVEEENYTRVIFYRPDDNVLDCGCQNYKNFINSFDLTFWSDPVLIFDKLHDFDIPYKDYEVIAWNHFCIWERYDYLLTNNNDTTFWNEYEFPEEFRCRNLPDDFLSDCEQNALINAVAQDTINMHRILDSLYNLHLSKYNVLCNNGISDKLEITWTTNEFLYTLYYYDQADNLIKTVPPEGVHVITNSDDLEDIIQYRKNIARYDTIQPGFIWPRHTMATNYRYNSLNQIVGSYHPDHDSTALVMYDILSRPVISQNGKQKTMGNFYSYTLFDPIGRIIQVGQLDGGASAITPEMVKDATTLSNYINSSSRMEITKTYYDRFIFYTSSQVNLRNRIADITYSDY